jgi:hypothetical protein
VSVLIDGAAGCVTLVWVIEFGEVAPGDAGCCALAAAPCIVVSTTVAARDRRANDNKRARSDMIKWILLVRTYVQAGLRFVVIRRPLHSSDR